MRLSPVMNHEYIWLQLSMAYLIILLSTLKPIMVKDWMHLLIPVWNVTIKSYNWSEFHKAASAVKLIICMTVWIALGAFRYSCSICCAIKKNIRKISQLHLLSDYFINELVIDWSLSLYFSCFKIWFYITFCNILSDFFFNICPYIVKFNF